MISLDIDLSYLSKHYNIGCTALQQYKNKSITQIMKIEAEKGNPKAAEFLLRITSNPLELVHLFQLVEPKNRFLILSNMNKEDLLKIMERLDPKQIILGLSVFEKDSIIELMMKLEPESLATVVLEKMDPEKFLQSIPEKYLDEFLSSRKIDKQLMLKSMEKIDKEQLQKMMENYTGEPCYEEKEAIIKKVSSLDDDKFQEAIKSFEIEGKQQLIIGLLDEKPELFEEFSPEAMVHPFKNMEKADVLESLIVLDTKELMPMVEDLPQDIMALVATQIDPLQLSQILCSDFSDIIASCGIA